MNEKSKTSLLLALDLFGTALFAIGAFGQFGGTDTLPPEWRFPGDSWLLITVGIALILPYMMHVIRKGARR